MPLFRVGALDRVLLTHWEGFPVLPRPAQRVAACSGGAGAQPAAVWVRATAFAMLTMVRQLCMCSAPCFAS